MSTERLSNRLGRRDDHFGQIDQLGALLAVEAEIGTGQFNRPLCGEEVVSSSKAPAAGAKQR
jgi:hypothetical protein